MDRTLKRAKRNNKRRGRRNHSAWQRFCPDGIHLPLLPARRLPAPHEPQGQPHFFRPATEAERRDPWVTLYRHDPVSSAGEDLPEGGSVLVKRMTVANRAELITAYCTACAESMKNGAGALLPEEPRGRRGGRVRENLTQENRNRRLNGGGKGETT